MPAKIVAAPVPLEYAVKASYIYKFAPFVTWPPDVLAAGSPFTICLAGDNDFGPMLEQIVRGQAIDGRTIMIKRLGSSAVLSPCQILFVGRASQAASLLHAAAGHPILTVTDHDRGPGGGIIDFNLKNGRVRFTIDAAAARVSGLQISSKLLGLAMSVNGR